MISRRAVLYARVSGDDRHREGRNLTGQLDLCREYAQAHGYEIAAELAEDDRGASGAAFELPRLNQVREMAQSRAFDVLVTRELDRLSRNLAKQLFVEEELRRGGVAIEYVLGEYPDTPEGNLMKNIRASVAEFERLKITERMVRGRRLSVKKGNVLVHGRPPYGYLTVHEDHRYALEIHEPEARIVRQIYEWYTQGDGTGKLLSMYAIQEKLSAMQAPTYVDTRDVGLTKKRGYGRWGRAQVARILGTETYAGTWYYGKFDGRSAKRVEHPIDEWQAVQVPAIVSRETWEAAQARRVQNKDLSPRNLKFNYLVRRRGRCGHCGAKISATPAVSRGKHYFYYACPAARSRDRGSYARQCAAPTFRADQVDALVWGWVRSLLTDPAALQQGLNALQEAQEEEKTPLRERLAALDELLGDNQQQLARLVDLYLTGNFPKQLLEERRGKLEAAAAELRKERDTLTRHLETQVLTREQAESLQVFAAQIAEGLASAEEDFAFRRFVIETLDVSATFTVENEEKAVYVQCVFGDDALQIASHSIHKGNQSPSAAGHRTLR